MVCCLPCCGERPEAVEDVEEGAPKRIKMNKNNRWCTDVIFLLVFIAAMGGVAAIISIANARGADPDRLIKGVDYLNRICGKDTGVENQPFAAWPWLRPDVPANVELKTVLRIKVCVSDCSETLTDARLVDNYPSNKFFKYCIPDLTNDTLKSTFEEFGLDGVIDTYTRYYGDFLIARYAFVYAAIVAVVLTLLFMASARVFAKVLVWAAIWLVVGGTLGLSYLLLHYESENNLDETEDANSEQIAEYLGWFLFAIAEVMLVVILILRDRIRIAVQVVREASTAIMDLLSLYLAPIIFFAIAIGYIVFWGAVAVLMFSVRIEDDEPSPIPSQLATNLGLAQDEVTRTSWDSSLRNAFAFHVLHLFWMTQFLMYATYITISGTLGDWYFTDKDEEGKRLRGPEDHELSRFPMFASLGRLLRYNMGTVAFAAMLMAAVQMAQAVITYMEANAWDEQNQVQRTVFAIAKCLLRCIECLVDKVNKNALVYCSIYGNNLCVSGARSLKIVWRNLEKTAIVEFVSQFIIVMGKLAVSFGTTALMALIFSNHSRYTDMSSIVLPCLFVFMISYVIASIILIIYESSIDTIFLCFLFDYETNKDGEMFASDSLKSIVQKTQKESKKIAARKRRMNRGQQEEVEVVEVAPTKGDSDE